MGRYYFDFHRDGDVVADADGAEFPNLERVRAECAQILAELAKSELPGTSRWELVIMVRCDGKPVLKTRLLYEAGVPD
jgi:hypothetical protein